MALRIITGIIGIIIAAIVIQLGGAPFAGFAIFLSLVGWHEYSSAFRRAGFDTAYIFSVLTIVLILCCAWLGNVEELFAVLTIGSLLIFLLTVLLSMRPTEACISIAGVIYIGIPFAHLIMLRFAADDPHALNSLVDFANFVSENTGGIDIFKTLADLQFDDGCKMVWILFACTWASDSFAYFVGSAIGSHRISPSISPNKTVEGVIGSLIGTVLTAIVVGTFLFGFSITHMAIAGVLIAVFATLGDLVESVIKRFTGIKDSGFLFPGHGGVLDRFDSIFYTAPIFYYFIITVTKLI